MLSLPILLAAIIIGYLLGATPVADRISRRRGIDISATGTRLAGAANVLRSVGKVPATMVLSGDLAKGALAVVVGQLLGVSGTWILLPALAAIVGHWRPVFAGFRGGDGFAVFGGVVIALSPGYGVASVAVALLVALGGQKMRYTSLLSVVFGYAALAAMSLSRSGDPAITIGLGGLAAAVLAHASIGHRRRRSEDEWTEAVDEAAGGHERLGL